MALAPRTAVRLDGEQAFAFVIRSDGTVERRAVRTGGVDGDRLEVTAGLRAGDRVVLSPTTTLATGMKVTIK
jgi:multidrug efflux pump subunit AcrA (membrane-fusion protein)